MLRVLISEAILMSTFNIWRGDSNEYPQHMFLGDSNGHPQHMFLWRTDENYPLIIIKYLPYLFFWICKDNLLHIITVLSNGYLEFRGQ